MIFRVIWTRQAENDLAQAWLDAASRESVATYSHLLELQIIENPFDVGESRESSVSRVAFMGPLGMWFDVIADDLVVIVRGIWLIR